MRRVEVDVDVVGGDHSFRGIPPPGVVSVHVVVVDEEVTVFGADSHGKFASSSSTLSLHGPLRHSIYDTSPFGAPAGFLPCRVT